MKHLHYQHTPQPVQSTQGHATRTHSHHKQTHSAEAAPCGSSLQTQFRHKQSSGPAQSIRHDTLCCGTLSCGRASPPPALGQDTQPRTGACIELFPDSGPHWILHVSRPAGGMHSATWRRQYAHWMQPQPPSASSTVLEGLPGNSTQRTRVGVLSGSPSTASGQTDSGRCRRQCHHGARCTTLRHYDTGKSGLSVSLGRSHSSLALYAQVREGRSARPW